MTKKKKKKANSDLHEKLLNFLRDKTNNSNKSPQCQNK